MNLFQHSYKFRNNVIRYYGIRNGGINSMQRYCFFLNYANKSTKIAHTVKRTCDFWTNGSLRTPASDEQEHPGEEAREWAV